MLYIDCQKHKFPKGSDGYHRDQVPGNMDSTLACAIFIPLEDLTEDIRPLIGHSVQVIVALSVFFSE